MVSIWIDEKNGITSYKLVENDFDIVHNLLEEIRWFDGCSWIEKDCSQFDNDDITFSKLRNPTP